MEVQWYFEQYNPLYCNAQLILWILSQACNSALLQVGQSPDTFDGHGSRKWERKKNVLRSYPRYLFIFIHLKFGHSFTNLRKLPSHFSQYLNNGKMGEGKMIPQTHHLFFKVKSVRSSFQPGQMSTFRQKHALYKHQCKIWLNEGLRSLASRVRGSVRADKT